VSHEPAVRGTHARGVLTHGFSGAVAQRSTHDINLCLPLIHPIGTRRPLHRPPRVALVGRPARKRMRQAVTQNGARQWPVPYWVSCRSQPARCIPAETRPMPFQVSSHRRASESSGACAGTRIAARAARRRRAAGVIADGMGAGDKGRLAIGEPGNVPSARRCSTASSPCSTSSSAPNSAASRPNSRTPDHLGDRGDRCPLRRVLLRVPEQHPHRSRPHFRRKPARVGQRPELSPYLF
jgi:hypothetical protein